jgi:RNA polymerase sigma-70 factor (ECF subfamily)
MKTEELSEVSGLIERAARGDPEGVRALLAVHRDRLKRVVRLRLSRPLQGRLNESDVVQEVFDDAARRLNEYLQGPALPLFLWLRQMACQKLVEMHRRLRGEDDHGLGDTGELTLHGGGLPVADAGSLAAQLLGTKLESRSANKAETRLYIQEALNSMEPIDREVLALKHFERLSFVEIAQVLELSQAHVGTLYLRAVKRLREILPWDPGSCGR